MPMLGANPVHNHGGRSGIRHHDILHIGWNLAVMDHLNVPRFESLIHYWGP
jgi:hypothetical protein